MPQQQQPELLVVVVVVLVPQLRRPAGAAVPHLQRQRLCVQQLQMVMPCPGGLLFLLVLLALLLHRPPNQVWSVAHAAC